MQQNMFLFKEISAELQKLHGEDEEWKNEVRQQMAPPDGHEMSPDEKGEYFAQVAKNRTELFDRLKKGTALRIKGTYTLMKILHIFIGTINTHDLFLRKVTQNMSII